MVLDSNLRTPLTSRLVRSAATVPLRIATVSRDAKAIGALKERGVSIACFKPGPDGRVPLPAFLRGLAEEGMLALLVEGGPTVHTSFLREGLADRVALGIAPVLVGGLHAPSWTRDLGLFRLDQALELDRITTRRIGRDLWIEGSIRRGSHV